MRIKSAIGILLLLSALSISTAFADEPPVKRPVAGGDLLLPYFEVDTTNPQGLTTLWSLRNNSLQEVDVEVLYFETDSPQAPQRRDVFTLAAKAIRTADVRFVPNLEVDADGVARGYVIFRGLEGADALQGDTFTITPDQNFASGQRLLNIDSTSPNQELCSSSTVRFLLGGGFTGGTNFRIWFEADSTPMGGDDAIVSYSVYSEAGGSPVFTTDLPSQQNSFEVDIETLLGPAQGAVNFGALEFSFSGMVDDPPRNRLGHVSATLDALGAYSVGIEATCNN
ncbi:MAG: hypothetical protein AAF725_16530 [Acidobacteriota bacterium]